MPTKVPECVSKIGPVARPLGRTSTRPVAPAKLVNPPADVPAPEKSASTLRRRRTLASLAVRGSRPLQVPAPSDLAMRPPRAASPEEQGRGRACAESIVTTQSLATKGSTVTPVTVLPT